MANLLQKASIVLTPTAYNNNRVMCVKPSDGNGDLTFSRNSAATRVNAKGLVKNVQILSSNLVQNGDFSEEGVQEVSNGSFSQEGSEEIVNGDFANGSTDWTLGSQFSIGTNKAIYDNSGSGTLVQSFNWQVGKTYKITFDIGDFTTSQRFDVYSGISFIKSATVESNTSYTIYFNGDGGSTLRFRGLVTESFSITNISVKEVGQDWTFTSGATLTDIGAKITHTPTAGVITQINSLVIGKNYKFTYEITESVSGGLKLNSAVDTAMVISVGVHTKYFEADATSFSIARTSSSNNDVTITNISVKEVGQNWSVNNTDANNYVEFGDGTARLKFLNTSPVTELATNFVMTAGKKYKLTVDVATATSGGIKIDGSGISETFNTSGISIRIINPTAATAIKFYRATANVDITLNSVSLIEITDDTTLPRINYEGFSYQDALGSELVTNGDFATDSDWTKTGITIDVSGLKAVFTNTANNGQVRQLITTVVGVEYNMTLNVFSGSWAIHASTNTSTSGSIATTGTTTTDVNLSFTATTTTTYILFYNIGVASTIGSIDNVSVKEYLGQEVVPDSGCGSWLWEPQSTNLITYSEDFSQWSKSFTNVDANVVVSPDGTLNASKITATSTSQPRVEKPFSVPSVDTKNTFSVFVKKGNTSYIALSRFSGSQYAIFDLDTISIVSQSSENATIKEMGNGWFRVSITQTVLSTDASNVWKINLTNGSSFAVGVVGEYVYTWGAQLEQQSYATSYIPTDGSSVTRNQDLCTNGGSLASINSTEGVLYFEGSVPVDGTFRTVSLAENNLPSNAIWFYISNQNRIQVNVRSTGNPSVYLASDTTVLAPNENFKVAVKYKVNDIAVWLNGVEIMTDNTASVPLANTLNNLSFKISTSGNIFFGKTKCLAVFPYLTDSELTALTTI